MKRSTIELEIAPEIEENAREIAKGEDCSVESVLEEGLALLFGSADEVHTMLDRLHDYKDEKLWALIYQRLTPSQDRRMRDLLYRGNAGTLTRPERTELEYHLGIVDRQILLRSKALALLKESAVMTLTHTSMQA